MRDALTRLEAALSRLGRQRLIDSLQPGLPIDKVRNALEGVGLSAPDELCSLYNWHDGTLVKTGDLLDDLHLFPGFYFSAFGEARQNYLAFRDDRRWRRSWFPVFANGGGDFYAVDCSRADSSPVVGFLIDQSDQPIEFNSLCSMVRTIADAFDLGVYFVDNRGYLEADDRGFADVARRNNPGIALWKVG